MPDEPWHYTSNQFYNSTTGSRKRMNILINDFKAKINARSAEHATFGAINTEFGPFATQWTTAYTAWRNKLAVYRGATQTLTNLLEVLTESGTGGVRSKIDEWDSKLTAHWSATDAVYVTLLPQGRAPFTSGGRDSIIAEVGNLATRLGEQVAPVGAAVSALQVQIDAITSGGGTPPQEMLDALEDAQDRVATLTSLQTKVAAFGGSLVAARTAQQGVEGQVDASATAIEAKRLTLAEELLGHLGTLMKHFRKTPEAAGDFFDLDTLMQSGPDEEPEPEPVVPTP
jgi:hypothetical protein